MTQYERMVSGLIYDPGVSEIMEEQMPFLDKLWEFNQLKPSQIKEKEKYMKEVFAECGENNYIELPRDDRREAKKHMLDSYPNLRGMYSEDDDNTEVLYFENSEINFCSYN